MAHNSETPAFLGEQVRKADPARYLSVLYAPGEKRSPILALYAFDAEIARVRDVVREPMAGEIRLHWWLDVLSGERQDEAAGNPLAAALIDTMDRFALPRAALDRYLQARLFDLYDEEFPDRNALEGYCGETTGTILQLVSLVLDDSAARLAGEAAGHGACAQAITVLLRQLPVHRARGRCFIPADILRDCGIDREGFLAGTDKGAVGAVIAAMAGLARDHLDRFRALASDLPKTLLPAYLPLAPVSACLDRFEMVSAAALNQDVDITPLRRNWLVMWRAVRGF